VILLPSNIDGMECWRKEGNGRDGWERIPTCEHPPGYVLMEESAQRKPRDDV
jgi:hypothetical protein